MTKGELVAALAAYPDGMLVMVDGCEDGLDMPFIRKTRAAINEQALSHEGEFEEVRSDDAPGFPVVVISRFDR